MLTEQQRSFWDENGYLILPGFFSDRQIDPVVHLHDFLWETRPQSIVVDDLKAGQRASLSDLNGDRSNHRVKVNDLYLTCNAIRQLSLDEQLTDILDGLFPDTPVLCNTLNMDFSPQQPTHVDVLYMTPQTEGHLIATWIALEDCHPNAAPLIFFPGSHKVPPHRFSNGHIHFVADEMPQWYDYLLSSIQKYGLKQEQFLPKKGDVFVWHAHLFHGSERAIDPSLTRKSLVSHYYTKSDCLTLGCELEPYGQAFWMRRSPPQLAEKRQFFQVEAIRQFPLNEQLLVGFHIDSPQAGSAFDQDNFIVSGWVIGKSAPALKIEILHENQIIKTLPVSNFRPDVAQAFPHVIEAKNSGFAAYLKAPLVSEKLKLQIRVVLANQIHILLGEVTLKKVA